MQKRPPHAQRGTLPDIPGTGMLHPSTATPPHTWRLYRNFASNLFTST